MYMYLTCTSFTHTDTHTQTQTHTHTLSLSLLLTCIHTRTHTHTHTHTHRALVEALRCKAEGKSQVILFNLCGHGNFDMAAYDKYNQGLMQDSDFNDSEVAMALAGIPKVPSSQAM